MVLSAWQLRKKRGSLYRHPSHDSRPSHCPQQLNEQRRSPRRYDIPHLRHTLSYDRVHLKLRCIHIHKASTVASFLTVAESCEVSSRQEQSVSKRFPINVTHPSGFRKTVAYRVDGAKLRNYYESNRIVEENNIRQKIKCHLKF